jgi:hypothetical protein
MKSLKLSLHLYICRCLASFRSPTVSFRSATKGPPTFAPKFRQSRSNEPKGKLKDFD